MTGLPRLSDIWQGCFTPPSHCSYRGIRAPHSGKEYRGHTHDRGFSDVFPSDLPGMPHVRDIELKIEL
jgi:hypothetical protein